MSKEWKEPRSNSAARIFQDFPNIPKREFTRKEFRMLVKVLSVVLAEWEGIGLCLEIAHKMMENLQVKWKKNSTMGLISVVDEWMKGNYEEKKLYPCWYSVVYVVADGLGGQNPAAARNIAQRWKTYEEDLFFSCPVAEQADITKLHTLEVEIRRRFMQQLWSDYLQSVGHRWFEIGVLLGVPINKLEVIENEQKKLMEVIKVWINLYDDPLCHYLPAPTIQILVDAVYNIMGGNDQALATKIADNVKAPVPSSPMPMGCTLSIAHNSTSTSVTQEHPQRQQEQAVQVFTETMTSDQLCSWLHRYQMPPNDCKTMKDKNIGGFAFKAITEGEKWNEFGISGVGLMLLKGPIMKEICPAVPDPGQRAILTGRSSASNGGGSGCGLAQGNGTYNTSAPPARSETASISEEDFSRVSEILTKHSPIWRHIGRGLRFKAHELDEIQSRPALFNTAPYSYLEAMLSEWQQWAPGDARDSTNYATLASLRNAVDKAGLGRIAQLF